jgi:hypothetical protein
MKEAELMQLRGVTRPEPIKETRDLIMDWERAKSHVLGLKDQLHRAKEDLTTIEMRLGNHMAPADPRCGETFNIWFGDGLLAVRYNGEGVFEISWRKRPREL